MEKTKNTKKKVKEEVKETPKKPKLTKKQKDERLAMEIGIDMGQQWIQNAVSMVSEDPKIAAKQRQHQLLSIRHAALFIIASDIFNLSVEEVDGKFNYNPSHAQSEISDMNEEIHSYLTLLNSEMKKGNMVKEEL